MDEEENQVCLADNASVPDTSAAGIGPDNASGNPKETSTKNVGTESATLIEVSDSASTIVSSDIQARFMKTVYFKYFDCISDQPPTVRCTFETGEDAKSRKCGTELKLQKGTYSNLKRHLELIHKFDIDSKKKTPAIDQFYKQATFSELNERKAKYPSNHPKQQAFDLAVIKSFALDGAPFSTVEKEGFQKLVEVLDRRIVIKSRKSYVNAISEIVSKEIIPSRQQLFQSVEKRFCHFSCDVWSSRKGEGILCIIAHYISNTWSLERKVLLFDSLLERHTGDHIRSVFLKCLADFNVPCDWGGLVVTDNASNMKKAFNLNCIREDKDWRRRWNKSEDVGVEADDEDNASLSSDSDDGEDEDGFLSPVVGEFTTLLYDQNNGLPIQGHLSCAAHTLQLAINNAIKNDAETKKILQYVNKVMVFFKRCIRWRDELRKICKDAPVNFVQTRWNSNVGMLERFVKNEFFSGVRLVLERASLDATTKSSPEPPLLLLQIKARELLTLLLPLQEATNELQGSGCTSNLLIIAVVKAFRKIEATRPVYYDTLRKSLLANLKTRMEPLLKQREYVLSALVDPRIRTSVFRLHWNTDKLDMTSEDKAITMFFEEYQHWFSDTTEEYNSENEMLSSVDPDTSLFGILVDAPKANPTKNEIDQYLSEPLSPATACPVKFWEGNSNRFRIISMIARKFLAIPATSAEVERIFSISGWLARARRSSITPKNVARLLMIRDESMEENVQRGTKRKTFE